MSSRPAAVTVRPSGLPGRRHGAAGQRVRQALWLLGAIIGVAAFNIVASLVMVVTDKTGDIAILRTLGMRPKYAARNPFACMDQHDVQELANFFERRVSAYQIGVTGEVTLDAAF